jgi:N-methylhydantoinase A
MVERGSTELAVGIDTGGTFCDFAARGPDGRVETVKVPSTPERPAEAIGTGLRELIARFGDVGALRVTVGTTVAINALLERRGPRVTLVATEGFTDVPFIARMDKARLYDLHWSRPKPLVRRRDCIGVGGRIDHHGREVAPLDAAGLATALAGRPPAEDGRDEVIAVCLLFSYLAPEHEREVARVIAGAAPGAVVSVSHEVSPVWREYERTSTTIADAFVKPVVDEYVASVGAEVEAAAARTSWRLLASNGGYLTARQARERPVQIILSGLAGGVVGASRWARAAGVESLFTLDMGGTSCDVGLIRGGASEHRDLFELGFGIPVTVPTVAVETIGAGGGSIVHVDSGGLPHVGPRSAGAVPGPIAYGRGGTEPTLTDANLVLGRLDPAGLLGGAMPLDAEAAGRGLAALGERLGLDPHAAALAAVRIADESMANAVRLIAVDRGLDPRDFALMAFGGAGPLHACAVARRMDIATVLVPPGPGLCSAFGALTAPGRVDRIRTVFARTAADAPRLERADAELRAVALADLRDTGAPGTPRLERVASMRYAGQNFDVEVPLPEAGLGDGGWDALLAAFDREHERAYGFALPGEPVEVIELRVTAWADEVPPDLAPPGSGDRRERRRRVWFDDGRADALILDRAGLAPGDELAGPAVVEEADSTTLLPPGAHAHVLAHGVLHIDVGSGA